MKALQLFFSSSQPRRRRHRIVRLDRVSHGGMETRSELLIRNASSLSDNGTFHCQAQNKAAKTISNFTLHVSNGYGTRPHQHKVGGFFLRLEHFVAVAVGFLVVLILILVAVALLLVRLCRRKAARISTAAEAADQINKTILYNNSENKRSILQGARIAPMNCINGTSSGRMPKHIQMGTGGLLNTTSSSSTASSGPPDILTDHQQRNLNSFSTASTNSAGSSSYKKAMDHIIDEYKYGKRFFINHQKQRES